MSVILSSSSRKLLLSALSVTTLTTSLMSGVGGVSSAMALSSSSSCSAIPKDLQVDNNALSFFGSSSTASSLLSPLTFSGIPPAVKAKDMNVPVSEMISSEMGEYGSICYVVRRPG